MKITVDFDCTPEEARRLMGLPDLTPLHDLYLDQLRQAFTSGVSPELIERMVRQWSPYGEAGANFWTKLFDQVGKPGGA